MLGHHLRQSITCQETGIATSSSKAKLLKYLNTRSQSFSLSFRKNITGLQILSFYLEDTTSDFCILSLRLKVPQPRYWSACLHQRPPPFPGQLPFELMLPERRLDKEDGF